MADPFDAHEKLFARAAAAIAEDEQLRAKNMAWQTEIRDGIR
ncbi:MULTISPECIES: hypothetical protein [Bradyrhizobium]|nr:MULTISPECIES: hypothetical protein [Bradyrhizobium]